MARKNRDTEISTWEERYRSGQCSAGDADGTPTPLLVEMARQLRPGRALDLACGIGRNAIWLAEQGWRVTAVDDAAAAIEMLRSRASERGVTLDAMVANLERGEYHIEPASWDLVVICYYLQRDLFDHAKGGLVPGGVLISIVHIAAPGEVPTGHRLKPGELVGYFQGWQILHSYEGVPHDAAHKRIVAEIVARKPEV